MQVRTQTDTCRRWQPTARLTVSAWMRLIPDDFFVHVFFDGNLGQ